jgi:hypothetical protein
MPGRYARAEAHRAERCPQPVRPVPGRCYRRWRVTWAASWAREAMSSLANTYTRWVCRVRREMYCPLADLRVGQPCP